MQSTHCTRLKLVVVGDSAVGKTCLFISYTTNNFPGDYVRSVFGSYVSDAVMVNGVPYHLSFWDTLAHKEECARLRPLQYYGTDVYLICYSVDNRDSFVHVEEKWLPELTHYSPNTPIVLVGTKTDLRGSNTGGQFVSFNEGAALAAKLNMGFAETSSLTLTGLKECFDKAAELAVSYISVQKKKGFFSFGGKNKKILHVPPVMPRTDLAPWIEIKTSTLGADMATILDDPAEADVVFHLDDGKSQAAHRLVLCSASDFFCRVFEQKLPKDQQENRAVRVPAFTWDEINSGSIAGLSSIKQAEEGVGHQIDVCLSADISSETFTHILRFLYAGIPNVDEDTPEAELDSLLKAADVFYHPRLREIVANIQNSEEFLNPSIGTYLNDLTGQRSKELFFSKPVFSDVQFEVEGQVLYAHKAILKARCAVMAGMFSCVFAESSTSKIPILETSLECFMAILEYIYTDHAPIEEGDAVGILVTAERFTQDRLKNLCELYITKEVDVSVTDRIEEADIDVIGLLQIAQFHNADQLSAWCLHFISSNYLAFERRAEFSQLEGDNLAHVTEKRWPPVSYLEEVEIWESKYGDQKKKSDEKCSVM